MSKFDVYEKVTKLIIDRLEAGVIPWRMPWKVAGGMPQNLVSKKIYRGFNFHYLRSFGFDQPYFLSFKQAKDLGGHVKKGAKSIEVIFWKMREHVNTAGEVDRIPMLRYYRVFHINDVEGIDMSKIPQLESHDHDFTPIEACENLIENWKDKPLIETGKTRACYIPSQDVVHMPDPRTFFEDSEYFSALFHELTHSTGHSKRLKRDILNSYGTVNYAFEELVAELGASYLCALCGIENKTIDNSAAYIQSWLRRLKDDNKFFVNAASKAQHATDYICQTQFETVEADAETEENKTQIIHSF